MQELERFPTSFVKRTRALTANEEIVIDCPPSTIVQCTSGDAVFVVRPDGQNPCDIETGLGFKFEEYFTKLRVKSTTTQTISLYLGNGEIQDNRLVGNVDISGGIRTAANRTPTAPAAHTAGTSAAKIVDENTARGVAVIQNVHASNDLYIGIDNTVTTSNGLKVAAGGSIRVTHDAEIWGIASGAGTSVRWQEETL